MRYGDEVPYQLADEVFNIPKPGGSGPDFMRFINLLDSTGKLLFGCWLSYVLEPYRHRHFGFTDGRGFLTVWRSDMQSGTVPVGQAGASVNNSGML